MSQIKYRFTAKEIHEVLVYTAIDLAHLECEFDHKRPNAIQVHEYYDLNGKLEDIEVTMLNVPVFGEENANGRDTSF
jgi:hypothetical protein